MLHNMGKSPWGSLRGRVHPPPSSTRLTKALRQGEILRPAQPRKPPSPHKARKLLGAGRYVKPSSPIDSDQPRCCPACGSALMLVRAHSPAVTLSLIYP